MLERVKDLLIMLVFGLFEGDWVFLDVFIGLIVGEVKKMFQIKFNIYIDEMNCKDIKVFVFYYSGFDLEESWCFIDLGIFVGVIIKVFFKEEILFVLYIYMIYN